MQSNEMRIMLLHVKVSDNLLRLFGKMKHKFTVKISMTVRPCLEFPQKNKYVDLALTCWSCKYVAREFT